MTYQLTSDGTVFCSIHNTWIPPDPANTDYAAYLEWVEAGNTPDPAPEQPASVELTPAEKLAASGLTVDELKALLGLD
jgi:hypothetical protein